MTSKKPYTSLRGRKGWPAFAIALLVVSLPVTALTHDLLLGASPTIRQGALEPIDALRGATIEDMLARFGLLDERDDTLGRLLDYVGATPENPTLLLVESHVLGLAQIPVGSLPGLYEIRAGSSSMPLREAVETYATALSLADPKQLLADPSLALVDDLPPSAQTAMAVLLLAMTDATMLQKKAVGPLSPQELIDALAAPGLLAAAASPSRDETVASNPELERGLGLLGKVDRQLIDAAALIMVGTVAHVLPTLRDWAALERQHPAESDPRFGHLKAFLERFSSAAIDRMDPIHRLDILSEALRVAAASEGIDIHPGLAPLPPPLGNRPLREAFLDLGRLPGAATNHHGKALQEATLKNADQLPASLQRAIAGILVNEAALERTLLQLGDASATPEDQLHSASSTPTHGGMALRQVREGQVRLTRAIQQAAPVLEGWGLYWAHEQAILPATIGNVGTSLSDAKNLAQAMTGPGVSLTDILRLAGAATGQRVADAPEPPLPPRGSLVPAIYALYQQHGLSPEPLSRANLESAALALPPVVEQNAARILLAQLDALSLIKATRGSTTGQDAVAIDQGPLLVQKLMAGTFTPADARALRTHYAAMDSLQGTYLAAAVKVTAAADAAARELGPYVDQELGHASESESSPQSPEAEPWYGQVLSFLGNFQIIGTASAQSVPGDPYHVPATCPESDFSDCQNDVWFRDPLLGTIVVAGFSGTRFDPEHLGAAGQILTIALGGDDVYRNNAGGAFLSESSPNSMVALAMDFNGHDRYEEPSKDYSLQAVQGASVQGVGILYDRRGDDRYGAGQMAQGFGSMFGVGLLIDGDGDDRYAAVSRAQGAADANGLGLLVDQAGADRYTLSATHPNVSAGQGSSGGAAGIGILVDNSGPDRYTGGAQGNGSAGGIGILLDRQGADQYSRRHAASNSPFENGECWTSLRTPSGGRLNQTELESQNVQSIRDQATGYATNLSADVAILASAGQGLFMDLDAEVCKVDPAPFIPNPGVGADTEGPIRDLNEQVENAMAGSAGSGGMLFSIPGQVAIGDGTATTYKGAPTDATPLYGVIIDIGGDDTYTENANKARLLVDLGQGDDDYLAPERTGVQPHPDGLLVDLGGDDEFVAKNTAQGANGILFDADGKDTYIVRGPTVDAAQGSAYARGLGMLLDAAGNDTYSSPMQANVYSRLLSDGPLGIGSSNGFFIDLAGDDTYQPTGSQGKATVALGPVANGKFPPSSGDSIAVFLDGSGADKYLGTPATIATPDKSLVLNNRLRWNVDRASARSAGALAFTPWVHELYAASVFWDTESARASTTPSPGSAGGFQLAGIGFAVGSAGPETYKNEYALVVDPGGDDHYENNAGGSVFRSDLPAAAGNSVDTTNFPIASLLIDLDGNDAYGPEAAHPAYDSRLVPTSISRGGGTQGAGLLGIGILIDDVGRENPDPEAGADSYVARGQSQGFGATGVGILWDRAGNDHYSYDPAVVRNPVVDGNMVAWSQLVPPSGTASALWELRARAPSWNNDCRLTVPGETGSYHGAAIQRGAKNHLAFSTFNGTLGLWRLFQVENLVEADASGTTCGPGGIVLTPAVHGVRRVAEYGSENPASNQLNPQFALIQNQANIIWQDDRDGTQSLYRKRLAAAIDDGAIRLANDRGLLGSHDPRKSNQINPHVYGSLLVYQDDRYAGKSCPPGTWSIHRFNLDTGEEAQLSSTCGLNAKPRISNDFVVWQTRPVHPDTGEPTDAWDVAVFDLAEQRLRVPTITEPGDQYEPVVAGRTILYSTAQPNGDRHVMQYFWDADGHRVERAHAIQPALDPTVDYRAAWVGTEGRPAIDGNFVGSDYWEIYRHDLGPDAMPDVPGLRRSASSETFSSNGLQGASQTGGIGILFDEGGTDQYNGDRMAQGSAVTAGEPLNHYSLISVGAFPATVNHGTVAAYAVLMDANGNDDYRARGESQGTHFGAEVRLTLAAAAPVQIIGRVMDLGQYETSANLGLLADVRGNDNFAANRNSQGFSSLNAWGGLHVGGVGPQCNTTNAPPPCVPMAGVVASLGIFVDLAGDDAYRHRLSPGNQVPIDAESCGGLPLVDSLVGLALSTNETLRQVFGPQEPSFNQTFDAASEGPFATLNKTMADLMAPFNAICLHETLTNEPPKEPTDARNNKVWTQRNARTDCGSIIPSPCTTRIGGVGMDLPVIDHLNGALGEVANSVIQANLEVQALGSDGEVQEGTLRGALELAANASFRNDKLGLTFERAEFFENPGPGFEFLGSHVGKPKVNDGWWRFLRPWFTNSEDFPDGLHEIKARVHYKHSESDLLSLGYKEKVTTFKLDNFPRILAAGNTPFVSDSITGDPLSAFSPFPYANDRETSGQPRITFRLSRDADRTLRSLPHDGWVKVEVLDASQANVVATLLDQTANADSIVSTIWDGTRETASGIFETVASGGYWLRISATDRDPQLDPQEAARRTSSSSFPVVVYANTPNNGCTLSAPSAPCNAGLFLNLDTPGAEEDASGTLTLPLTLTADTDPGAAPPGYEAVRRFHVRLGRDAGNEIEWNQPIDAGVGASFFPLRIRDGETWHVIVLAEDRAGNLECAPACGGERTGPEVTRGDDTGRTALLAAFARKLAHGTLPGAAPVYATFTADLQRPSLRNPEVLVDGLRPTALVPRLGADSELEIRYQLDEEGGVPNPILEWWPASDPSQVTFNDASGGDFDIEADASHAGARSRYNATWKGWPKLVAGWPHGIEGIVSVRLDADDLAGNGVRQQDQPRLEFLLDRTPPSIRDVVVEYPDGRFHAEEGDQVRILVRAADPGLVGFVTPPRDLHLAINASDLTTAASSPGSCSLWFEPGLCFRSQLRQGSWETFVPVQTQGMPGMADLRAAIIPVTVTVADLAGNSNETLVPIVFGAPQLGLQPVAESVGVYNARVEWSTAEETSAYLLFGEGSSFGDLDKRVNSTTPEGSSLQARHHTFSIEGLEPGTTYAYRVIAADPATGALEAGALTLFSTRHGVAVRLETPQPELDHVQVLSGLFNVKGKAWIQSALDSANQELQPRIELRLLGPGLPPTGRVVYDAFPEDGNFSLDLVTEAVDDGLFALEAKASYAGEAVTTTIGRLLIDNTAPQLEIIEPAPHSLVRERPERLKVRVSENLTGLDAATVRLHVNGREVSVRNLTYYPDGDRHDGVIELAGLARILPGILRLEVFADDAAKNPGYATTSVLYDPDAPQATSVGIVYPAGQQAAQPGQWVTIFVDQTDGVDIARVTADTSVLGTPEVSELRRNQVRYSLELSIPLGQAGGAYAIPVRTEDAAGNPSLTDATLLVDSTHPRANEITLSASGPDAAIVELTASEPVAVSLSVQPADDVGIDNPIELASRHAVRLQGLQPGTTYEVEVNMRDGAGLALQMKRTFAFLPDLGKAPAVRGLVATPTAQGITLSWDSTAGFQHVVYRASNASFAIIGTTTAFRYVDEQTTDGTDYQYFVQAREGIEGYGPPSPVVLASAPEPNRDASGTRISVHPRSGIADGTQFVFTATLNGARQPTPSVWLVLDGTPHRMSKSADEQCTTQCTFHYRTFLPGADLAKPTTEYYVEVFDSAGVTRFPSAGSLEGPTVLSRDDEAARPAGSAPAGSWPILLLALVAGLRRCRRHEK